MRIRSPLSIDVVKPWIVHISVYVDGVIEHVENLPFGPVPFQPFVLNVSYSVVHSWAIKLLVIVDISFPFYCGGIIGSTCTVPFLRGSS